MPSLLEHLEYGTASQLFVHCATSLAPGLDRYPERALVLARPHDIVCVSEEVDPGYLHYLAELGLGPRADNVLAASRFGDGVPGRALWARLAGNTDALRALGTMVRRQGSTRLQPLIASQGQFALAAALEVAADIELRVAGGDPDLVQYADQKHHIRAKALELGIPVAEGEVVELQVAGGRRRRDYDLLRASVERHLRRTGRVIVRGASGSAGSATFVVGVGGEDVDGLLRRLAGRSDNRIYLVEVMVPVTVSPNIQLHLDPAGGRITCVGVTDQRWERTLVPGGNLFPSSGQTIEAMLAWSYRLADWLLNEGYAGLLGLDFVEYADPDSGKPRTFLAEVNPRACGATYPLAVLERLNAVQRSAGRPESAAFVSGTIDTRPRGFAGFRQAAAHLLYQPETGCGAVPYNIASLGRGKCGVVVLGASRDAVLRSYGELQTWSRREAA